MLITSHYSSVSSLVEMSLFNIGENITFVTCLSLHNVPVYKKDMSSIISGLSLLCRQILAERLTDNTHGVNNNTCQSQVRK